jgi:hypothetical protein
MWDAWGKRVAYKWEIPEALWLELLRTCRKSNPWKKGDELKCTEKIHRVMKSGGHRQKRVMESELSTIIF